LEGVARAAGDLLGTGSTGQQGRLARERQPAFTVSIFGGFGRSGVELRLVYRAGGVLRRRHWSLL
jgi:hypothetical protein